MNTKIITQNICPPIPSRAFDWIAYQENSDETGPYGFGKTKKEAIKDLNELIDSDFTEDLAWLKTM